MCVLPPQTPCFFASLPVFASVARGELLPHCLQLSKFLQVSTQHVYRSFHVILVVYASGEGSFFFVGSFLNPLSPVCIVAIHMEQLCTQVVQLSKYWIVGR